MEPGSRIRRSVRALLVTPEREILLVRWSAQAIGRSFWITPGGGVEAGETERQAAAREIAEETGLAGATIGPAVWTRSVAIPWGDPPFTQRETYFWVPTPRFEPSRAAIPTSHAILLTSGGTSPGSSLSRNDCCTSTTTRTESSTSVSCGPMQATLTLARDGAAHSGSDPSWAVLGER